MTELAEADRADEEQWRPVPGYPFYEASSLGRVRSLDGVGGRRTRKGRILRQNPDHARRGYLAVHLVMDGISKTTNVHNIICAAFHGPCPTGAECSHENGNRKDNRSANLEYRTKNENECLKILHGTVTRGEKIGNSKLTEEAVRDIHKLIGQGVTQKEIAARYLVNHRTISDIARQDSWRHVK
jgi:hypothetical protein